MQEHPLIELYVSIGNDIHNKEIEQMLSTIDLDDTVLRTLHEVGIAEQVMLTLLITDDEGIRDMNKQYRDQNKPTDILSFPLPGKPLVEAPAELLWQPKAGDEAEIHDFVTPPGMVMNLGDIMMSWPTLVRQANEAGHSAQRELLYLLCHGILHLVGYDDQTEAGYQEMLRIQQYILSDR
jgi:probable rRNA maturation factor